MNTDFAEQIFFISSLQEFEYYALEIFRFQYSNCEVYQKFISNLNINPNSVNSIYKIPFLPVEFFKTHSVKSTTKTPEMIFSSSATTGLIQSKHSVAKISIYEASFEKAFEIFYGDVSNYAILALLPSYLEREGSSLIYMADNLIKRSNHSNSGYFLYNHEDLYQSLIELQKKKHPTILIGVTYALLDFVESYPLNFPELIVMETGGMKGKRREMIRKELHEILCNGFGVSIIHSEYGMTELLSQAYSKGNGVFKCPPWMNIFIRDTNDPLTLIHENKTGGINIIDLANIYSCSFIATQDLGQKFPDGTFEVAGRFDNSDIRGCNLLVQ